MNLISVYLSLMTIICLKSALINTDHIPPALCGSLNYAADNTDCSKYFICNNSSEIIGVSYCPYGQLFDFNSQKCLISSHATCFGRHK